MDNTITLKLVPVRGCDGYFVTDCGLVFSNRVQGAGFKRKGKLRPRSSNLVKGYPSVTMNINGNVVRRYVHDMVAEAFLGARPNGCFVLHCDGNKQNTHVSNLRYGTPKDNGVDSVVLGESTKGSKNGQSKIEERDVIKIRHLSELGVSQKIIAMQYGITQSNVSNIVRHKTWQHLTGDKV